MNIKISFCLLRTLAVLFIFLMGEKSIGQTGQPIVVLDESGKIKYTEYVDTDVEFGRTPGYSKYRIHHYYEGKLLRKSWYTDVENKYVDYVICGAVLTKYKYDKSDRMVEKTVFEGEENPFEHDCEYWHKLTYKYDENDNVVCLKGVNLKNDLVRLETASYNKFQMPDTVKSFNRSEELTELKVHSYNTIGQEIMCEFLDSKLNLKKGKNTIAYIEFLYSGDVQIQRLFNFEKKLIKTKEILIESKKY